MMDKPIKSGRYVGGAFLGKIKFQAAIYDVYLSKCETTLLYKRKGFTHWTTTRINYLPTNANSFCRDAWKLLEAHRDPSVSPMSK